MSKDKQIIATESSILMTSHSPKAPFSCVFDSDTQNATFSAIVNTAEDADVMDVILFSSSDYSVSQFQAPDIKIIWSDNGEQAACVFQNHIQAYFDFEKEIGYSRTSSPTDSHWKRQSLEWSDTISNLFSKELFNQMNLPINAAISQQCLDPTQDNRLNLFKQLFKATLLVPLMDPEDDPEHKILTFPYQETKSIVSCFTDYNILSSTIDTSIPNKRIRAVELFRLVQQYDIKFVMITNSDGQSVILDQDDYPVLGILPSEQDASYAATIDKLGTMFIKPLETPLSDPLQACILSLLNDYNAVDSAYLFQSKLAKDNVPILGVDLSERDERRLVQFFQDFTRLLKDHLEDRMAIELSVLDKGTYLHSVTTSKIPAFYTRK